MEMVGATNAQLYLHTQKGDVSFDYDTDQNTYFRSGNTVLLGGIILIIAEYQTLELSCT